MRSADLVFVSHNHPDHCHLETLALLDRNKPIVVPDFASKAVQKILELGGHTNIIPLQLCHAYRITDTEVSLAILKSGNFRDDSGIYLAAGDFEMLQRRTSGEYRPSDDVFRRGGPQAIRSALISIRSR